MKIMKWIVLLPVAAFPYTIWIVGRIADVGGREPPGVSPVSLLGLFWLAGLAGIPDEMYEAARIDGAGAMARFRYITVPCLAGTFCLVGILSVVNSFRVYREAYLLAGPYPDASIYLIPHLFAHWFLNLDIQKMTAAAVIITAAFLIPGGLGWLLVRILSAGERKGE